MSGDWCAAWQFLSRRPVEPPLEEGCPRLTGSRPTGASVASTPPRDDVTGAAVPDVCTTIADAICALERSRPVLVGVDGRDGAGKTRFADELAGRLRSVARGVQRVELDRFLNPRARRHARGRWSPDGFFHDSYDLDAVEQWVLGPLRGPASQEPRRIRTGVYDLATEAAVIDDRVQVADDAVVVVDGMFLHRRSLRDVWDLTVFLQVDPAVSFGRLAARDGTDPDPDAPSNRRYRDGMRQYLEECDPASLATFLVDDDDVGGPAIVARRESQ